MGKCVILAISEANYFVFDPPSEEKKMTHRIKTYAREFRI